ncbi:MAG TPA: UPF0175 family protein [Dongiaceae bacterium]|nr:UPF0175 family protein [Dongiaceae bacterium]
MSQITLTVPDTAPIALRVPPDRLSNELLLAAAMMLYATGRLSSGAAAELAGMSKPLFLQRLAEYGVAAFRQSPEELSLESQNA